MENEKWEIGEHGSNPNDQNDDWNTSDEYESEDLARAAWNARKQTLNAIPKNEHKTQAHTTHFALHRPGGEIIEIIEDPRGSQALSDEEDRKFNADWNEEIAMQAGMMGGIQAYNDHCGYDSYDPYDNMYDPDWD
tara:strand:+ start:1686 stop:2090 length:405 start_codon:yes stop_codon:yes gene_type:complete